MREAIKAKLAERIPELSGRCYDSNEPDASTPKPFAVVSQRDETCERPETAYRRKYRIHLCADAAGTFSTIDGLADKTIAALHNVNLVDGAGNPGVISYGGSRWEDRVDADFGAITRSLDFWLNGLERPNASGASDAPDSWLESLAQWTESKVDAGWRVYRDVWPSDAQAREAIPASPGWARPITPPRWMPSRPRTLTC